MNTRSMILISVFSISLGQSAYAQSFFSRAPGLESIKARIAELNPPDKGLSENEFSLADERRDVEQEIATVRLVTQLQSEHSKDIASLEEARTIIVAATDEIKKVDCAAVTQNQFAPGRKMSTAYSRIQNIAFENDVSDDLSDTSAPWEGAPEVEGAGAVASAQCMEWKKFLEEPNKPAELVALPDSVKQQLVERQKEMQEHKSQAAILLDLLQKRKDAIQKKLTARVSQSSLSSNLWIVIGMIGGFSVLAIFVVKLFDKEIQIEWVASGQVIQFVTVMILLSTIMALGLAGILKENTLGTLLGGIAGYVLAQGVGRAVARNVSRSVSPNSGLIP